MSIDKRASADHPIHDLVAQRWSPYAFDPRPVAGGELRSIFEAARWAASSMNEQPWRYIVARRETSEEHERLLSCLVPANREWAKNAPVLALGVAGLVFARNRAPNATALHDLGLASATLTIEATARGLHVHQMGGILPERAAEIYRIPSEWRVVTALAIGYLGSPDGLPEKLRGRDLAARGRRPSRETVFEGEWGKPSPLFP
ncbi:MAG: nitroreductase family protein [Candidatus Eisenbacteria bacterium]